MVRARQPAVLVVLALLILPAFAGCASRGRGREVVSFSHTDDEARAFTVLVLVAKAPVLKEMTFRLPIERVVHVPSVGAVEAGSVSLGGSCGGLSGDNPFSGTGSSYSYCVYVLRANEEGAWIKLSLSWRTFESKRGEYEKELFFRWGEPTEQQLDTEVGVETWFEAPKPAASKSSAGAG